MSRCMYICIEYKNRFSEIDYIDIRSIPIYSDLAAMLFFDLSGDGKNTPIGSIDDEDRSFSPYFKGMPINSIRFMKAKDFFRNIRSEERNIIDFGLEFIILINMLNTVCDYSEIDHVKIIAGYSG